MMGEKGVVRLRYVGIAPFASLVGQLLREEGIEVSWEPPEERRGLSDMAADAVVGVTVHYLCKVGDVTVPRLKARLDDILTKIRKRIGSRGTIDIEPDQDESE